MHVALIGLKIKFCAESGWLIDGKCQAGFKESMIEFSIPIKILGNSHCKCLFKWLHLQFCNISNAGPSVAVSFIA